MKKSVRFVAMMIVVAMSLSMFVSAVSLDALKKAPLSFEGNGTFYMTLDEPLGLLSHPDVVASVNEEISPFGVDLALLVDSLFGSKFDYTVKTNVSEDYKKGEMYVKYAYHIPAQPDDKFKIQVDALLEMWANFDLSNPDDPKAKIIIDYPMTGKYIVFDLADLIDGETGKEELKVVMQYITKVIDPEYISSYNDKALEIIAKHAQVKTRLSRIEISLDNNGFAGLMGDSFGLYAEMVQDMVGEALPEEQLSEVAQIQQMLPAILGAVNILGENGIKMEYIFNHKGVIKAERASVNVNINLYDILTSMGVPEIMLGVITKDNSTLAFTTYADANYTAVNDEVEIEYPVLTEENTYNIADEFAGGFAQPEPDFPATEEVEYNDISILTEEFFLADSTLYFPYESVASENNSSSANDKLFEQIKPQLADGLTKLVLKDENGVEKEISLQAPVVEKDGKLYVDISFVKSVFEQELSFADYMPEYGLGVYFYELDPDFLLGYEGGEVSVEADEVTVAEVVAG